MNRSTLFIILQGHNLEAAAQFSAVLAVKTGGYIVCNLQKENNAITYSLFLTLYCIFQLLCNNIRINEKRSWPTVSVITQLHWLWQPCISPYQMRLWTSNLACAQIHIVFSFLLFRQLSRQLDTFWYNYQEQQKKNSSICGCFVV